MLYMISDYFLFGQISFHLVHMFAADHEKSFVPLFFYM